MYWDYIVRDVYQHRVEQIEQNTANQAVNLIISVIKTIFAQHRRKIIFSCSKLRIIRMTS